jgi:hypothetical protein
MKKSLLTIALMSVLWSCNRKENLYQSGAPTPKNNIANSGGDGLYDVLGFGYDVTKEYVFPTSSRFQIIDVARLKSEHPSYVDISRAEIRDGYALGGQNAEDFVQVLTLKANVGYDRPGSTAAKSPPLFKGTIDATFTNGDRFSSKYIYGSYDYLIRKKVVQMLPDVNILKDYLDPGFAARLQYASAQDIVRDYGTHVLVNISLGGHLSLLYQAESTSSEKVRAAEVGATFAYAKVVAGAKVTYDSNLKSNNSNETAKVRTIGGNSSASLLPTTVTFSSDGTPSARQFDFDSWSAGVTDDNSQLVQINQQGAIRLDELVTDPGKKAALKQYIDDYLLSNQVLLSYDNSNVYKTIAQGMADYSEGGGLALGKLNGNDIPDAVFMMYRVNMNNEIRYQIGYDMRYGVFGSKGPIKSIPGLGGASEGAGIAIADIDRNGQDDIIVMGHEALNGNNEFRYKIGYNINSQGDATNWSAIKTATGMADKTLSAGITFGDINGNGTLDLILMAYDIPSGSQQIRYKVGYDISPSGDVNWSNGSSVQYASGMADVINGASITLSDIDNNGILDLVVAVEDNPDGENEYRYKIGYDINQSGIVRRWSTVVKKRASGWGSDGSGIAFGNFDNNPSKDVILMSLDAPDGPNEIRYKVGFNVDINGLTYSWL